jgi:type II secretory pathway component GspD/PulD (secretin)
MISTFLNSVICRSKLPLAALLLVFLPGCGDFFAQKETRLQSQQIVRELSQIRENTNVTNPLPEFYRQGPELIEVTDGIKLIYYCKNHSAEHLSKLIDTQFSKLFRSSSTSKDRSGKEYPKPTYNVSPNTATNQLVIHCPNREEVAQVLKLLRAVDVPPIQVNIDCLILERFADVTMDWETSIQIDNLFGEKITLGGKEGPEFPGASLREPRRSEFGLDIGFWNQKLTPKEFKVVVDMLVSRGYLKVLMNPSLETISGQEATITSRDYAPLEKIVSKPGFDEPFNLTEYQWVEDKLTVTPYVYADGSIGLKTEIMLGSRSKPEGIVQSSIITERFIKSKESRIEPGRSLVIGGMRKSEERSVVRGVPFLQDIPLIGILFSSKDFEEKAMEVIFILTPSISSGGVEYAEMIERVQQTRVKVRSKAGLQEAIMDPFGSSGRTSEIEKKAEQAELDRLETEIDMAQASAQIDQIRRTLIDVADQLITEMDDLAGSKP